MPRTIVVYTDQELLKIFELRTELELHIFNHFKNTSEPFTPDQFEYPGHILQEFADGYNDCKNEDGTYSYADPNEPNDPVLIKEFVRIVNADASGQYEYNSTEFTEIIIKAMEKFGL